LFLDSLGIASESYAGEKVTFWKGSWYLTLFVPRRAPIRKLCAILWKCYAHRWLVLTFYAGSRNRFHLRKIFNFARYDHPESTVEKLIAFIALIMIHIG